MWRGEKACHITSFVCTLFLLCALIMVYTSDRNYREVIDIPFSAHMSIAARMDASSLAATRANNAKDLSPSNPLEAGNPESFLRLTTEY